MKVDEDMEKLDNILYRMERDNLLNRDGYEDEDDDEIENENDDEDEDEDENDD